MCEYSIALAPYNDSHKDKNFLPEEGYHTYLMSLGSGYKYLIINFIKKRLVDRFR